MKTLKELSQEIHAINREKGFWDEHKTEMQCLLLVQSELFEALEAHRKGRITADASILDQIIYMFSIRPEPAAIDFENHIKDTMGDELADMVIRLLDFAAAFDVNFKGGEIGFDKLKQSPAPIEKDDFFTSVHLLNGLLSKIIDDHRAIDYFIYYGIIENCFKISTAFGINLEAHINAKIEYNRTRPKRHNKNY